MHKIYKKEILLSLTIYTLHTKYKMENRMKNNPATTDL